MRIVVLALALMLCACASQGGGQTLTPADSATAVIVGGPVTMRTESHAATGGEDPLVNMTLTTGDGRVMHFTEANHTPNDVSAQAAGGALSQVMGFFGDEQPTLYSTDAAYNSGAPFICAPDGPAMLGYYRAADGQVSIVGLRSAFEFEPRDNGTYEALPYSPDHVCARLKFRAG